MSSGLEFGVYQLIVHSDLVPAPLRRDEHNILDLRLEILKQFLCQVHGPVGEVSDSAINDGYF